jgi:hypothetical protein
VGFRGLSPLLLRATPFLAFIWGLRGFRRFLGTGEKAGFIWFCLFLASVLFARFFACLLGGCLFPRALMAWALIGLLFLSLVF